VSNVRELYATHVADSFTVQGKRQMLREAGSYCFESIKVRKVDGKIVIIDGEHSAKACYLENMDADIEYVGENELLTDDDIRNMPTLYSINRFKQLPGRRHTNSRNCPRFYCPLVFQCSGYNYFAKENK